MTRLYLIAFATVFGTVANVGAAVAQRAGVASPRPDLTARTLDQITTYDEMNACTMKPNVGAAKALLAATTIIDARKFAARFKWRACTLKGPGTGFMKVEPNDPKLDELRWMSADYFLRDAALIANLEPLPKRRIYNKPWFAASARDDSIDEMAACVADTNPAGILSLNKVQIGSKEEQAAFTALDDDFVVCLSAGVTLQGGRKAIRGALVDALYQRTQMWPITEAEKAGVSN